jgi:3-isopropylmalate/(R)-2-methylmalate dehydratase small subunit
MEKFTQVSGIAVVLSRENIDTDAIIPVSWMRSPSNDLGKGLFGGWRYDAEGNEINDFVLNRQPYCAGRFIVAGANFGCGSSREAAVWALLRFGIRCIIAPSFGDIFFENSFKNGLLPVVLSAPEVEEIAKTLVAANEPILTVDLERCVIKIPQGRSISFSLAATRRNALLEGLDEIALTLRHIAEINAFQQRDQSERPWIYVRRQAI